MPTVQGKWFMLRVMFIFMLSVATLPYPQMIICLPQMVLSFVH